MKKYGGLYLKFDEGKKVWTLRGQIKKNNKTIDEDRLAVFETDKIDDAHQQATTLIAENYPDETATIKLPKGMKLSGDDNAISIREEAEEDLQATWND